MYLTYVFYIAALRTSATSKYWIIEIMARNSNENEDDNIDPASVASNVKNTFKQEVIKELLNSSFEDNKTKLGNDALSLVVEVAKCLVTETCLRASNQALRESCDKVDIEHVEKCLPQLMLDFP